MTTTTRPRPWTPEEREEAHAAAREVGGHLILCSTFDGFEVIGERVGRGPSSIWWRGPDGRPVISVEAMEEALVERIAVRTW